MNPPAPDRHHSRAPRTTRSKRNGLWTPPAWSQNGTGGVAAAGSVAARCAPDPADVCCARSG